MSANDIGTILTGAIIIAIIYMLVRPGSPAAQAVVDVTGALAAMIYTTTGATPPTQNA